MATVPAGDEFTVLKRDMSDDSLYRVGVATLSPQGKLTIVSAEQGFERPLQAMFDTVNAQEEVRIKVPAPPGSGSYGLHARTATRDSPDIAAVVKEHLAQRHGLHLVAQKGKEA
jgi:hypothetical protein